MPFFLNDHIKLHFHEYGEGPEIMLAFHGFGMQGTQFRTLESAFSSKYKIYSFDLFFHGKTHIHNSSLKVVRKGLTAKEFAGFIQDFLNSMAIKDKKITLLSYSMGSLMALSLIESLPKNIDTAYFIAPDGIKPNKLLYMGSRSLLLNRLFYQLVYSPKTVSFLLNCLLRFGYIDASLYKILSREFETTESRLTCYNAITFHAKLSFNQDIIAGLMNAHNIRSYFYFGERDRLFPKEIGHEFSKKLKSCFIQVIDDGHDLVNQKLNELIKVQLSGLQDYD